MRLVRRMDAVDDRLEAAADHRERRAQLVAHVGEERLAAALVGCEPLGHRVEAPDELAERPRTALGARDPGGVVAGLHGPRRLDQRSSVRPVRHAPPPAKRTTSAMTSARNERASTTMLGPGSDEHRRTTRATAPKTRR